MADLPLYRAADARVAAVARGTASGSRRTTGSAGTCSRGCAPRDRCAPSEIPDTSQVSWASTGWTNNRNVTQMLEFLAMRGEVAVSGRDGKERVWDVAERVYPRRRRRAVRPTRQRGGAPSGGSATSGIARPRAADQQPVEPIDVGADRRGGDGGRRRRRLAGRPDAARAGRAFEPRTALLSPFDRLVFDRARAQDLFGFEYIVEMYKPAAKRRWGYFALPILHGDRLIGKLDAAADRKAGLFRVAAIHEDEPFQPRIDRCGARRDPRARGVARAGGLRHPGS